MQEQVTTDGYKESNPIRHSPPKNKVPIVEVYKNSIVISNLVYNTNINMLLKDDSILIYDVSANVLKREVSFEIPHEILEDATTITITIDGITYIGEF